MSTVDDYGTVKLHIECGMIRQTLEDGMVSKTVVNVVLARDNGLSG